MFADCCGLCGLATCFGATTVMPGSGVADPVAVCDTAVPLGPHSNTVDRIATDERATKLGDNLMAMSSQIQAGWHLADIHHRRGDCADQIEQNSR